jgi:adenylate cyclase class 2
VLRLRRTPHGGWLTHKAPLEVSEGTKSRQEFELEIEDPDTLQRIFEALGYAPTFRYQKYRTTFSHQSVEIVLDETPIGAFLEIEGPIAAIHETAHALGFEREDYIAESYVSLFFAGGGEGDMLF